METKNNVPYVSFGYIALMKGLDFAYKKTGISIADYKMKMLSAFAIHSECDAEGGARFKPQYTKVKR